MAHVAGSDHHQVGIFREQARRFHWPAASRSSSRWAATAMGRMRDPGLAYWMNGTWTSSECSRRPASLSSSNSPESAQQARTQFGIDLHVAQGRFPVVVPVHRQVRPDAAVVDAQDDDGLGHGHPAVALAGAGPRIHIAGMGSEQAQHLAAGSPLAGRICCSSLSRTFLSAG